MAEGFDTVKASSHIKNLLKVSEKPQSAAVDHEKKNTNKSASTKTKEDSHGTSQQSQHTKYPDRSLETFSNRHNNELLKSANSMRPESVRENQKSNNTSYDGRYARKGQQNSGDSASLAQKASKGSSSASFQNRSSESCDPREASNLQRHPSDMKKQKHSTEAEFFRKSDNSTNTSRKNYRKSSAAKSQGNNKPFRNSDDGGEYVEKVGNPNQKESMDEKHYAQESDGKKQMELNAEKQNKTDNVNNSAEKDAEAKEFLMSLKENKIQYLPKKNPRFPKANYFCSLCDFHLNIEEDCSKHLIDVRHLRKKKLHDEDAVLRSIPKPTERQFAALTAAVEEVYTEHGISVEEKKQRADSVLRLEKVLKEKIPDVVLYMYGSSLTGFGMKTSDINVNLASVDKNKKLTTLLKETYAGIKDQTDSGFSNVRPDFTAKVPGLYVTDDKTGLTLSIAIHCYKAHCSSQLLSIYSDFDIRVSKLAVAFRYWAHLCELDRHHDGFIPPQAFNLMVIYFLQQMNPQLVPIIKPPEVTGEETGDYQKDSTAFEKMRAKVLKVSTQSRNSMSVGELWFRLLRFYCLEFDTPSTVVCIRSKEEVPRNIKPWNSKKLAIEDPYMLKKNVTGMVNQLHVCEYWEDCIRQALHYFGFPRNAEGKSHIPIDAFMKMVQHNEASEACPPVEVATKDEAIRKSSASDGSVSSKKDKSEKTLSSKSSRQQTDDHSSSDSGNEAGKASDTEGSEEDDDDGVKTDQPSTALAGSNSQMKSAALSYQGSHPEPATFLKNQSLKHNISDSGTGDSLSQTTNNGYIPPQAHGSNLSIGTHQQQVLKPITRPKPANSTINNSKNAVTTAHFVHVHPEKDSHIDSSCLDSQRLSLSSSGTPADEVTDDDIDHKKLTEAMNDIFLLLELTDCHYIFSKEFLTDGKGPVLVCAYCEKVGHLKNACPDDKLPEIFPLPPLTDLHVRILTDTLNRVPAHVGLSKAGSFHRVNFLKGLEAFIRTHFDDANLTLFGSSCNGFGFERSDMDICLTFNHRKVTDKPWVIESLARKMRQSKEIIKVQAISTAKVPIVKFTVRGSGLEGDISLYNILAQHNTRLLLCYSEIDPRVKILGCAIKYFAKVSDIGDASRGSLSSYAYILMMIYYLQQVSPPVVPVLQELYDGKQKPQVMVEDCDVWFMDDLHKLNTLWLEKGKNKMTVAELWIGFLRFYVEEFNCKEIVVSIRQKELVTRFDKLWNGESIAIEDPFDHSHNLGSGLTRNMNNFIFKTFINGRMLHGCSIDNNMEIFRKYRNPFDYFFSAELLSESRPLNVRGCHFCGKMGHVARQCPAKKAKEQQDNQQKPFQQQKKQQLPPQRRPEVLVQEEHEAQQNNQGKQRSLPQIQQKQQAHLTQPMQQEKQLLQPQQPNLPSQQGHKTQQSQNNNIQVQHPSKQNQHGDPPQPEHREPLQPELPEARVFQQPEQHQYNKPLEPQQHQRNLLPPQPEERKQQPSSEQQQTVQPKQHQRSQSSQLQQHDMQQRQPLLHHPVQSAQLQEHQQVQSSQQKQLPQTQQIDHLSKQLSQTSQQSMQPFQHPQQRPPSHQQQQQQITQSLRPQQPQRQPFMPQQQYHRPALEQQFRQPFQHQIRHSALSQEKHAVQFQQQPSHIQLQRQNQYPQSQQQLYHHSQPQNYQQQQQLQQPTKLESYDSKQEQNHAQQSRTGKVNSSPEPATAIGYVNQQGLQAAPAVMSGILHSQVFHNTSYMQQRHNPQQSHHQHQQRGYTHNAPLPLPAAMAPQPHMLPQPSNFRFFGNGPILVNPNVLLQPYPHPTPIPYNPGSGYPQHTQTSYNPGNGYSTQAARNPGNGHPHNNSYNKGSHTAGGMPYSGHSGGDGSLNVQFMNPAVQSMFDSAREQ
ncbi:hypothetical protein BsWGS_02878 [Bradybaena similaris]